MNNGLIAAMELGDESRYDGSDCHIFTSILAGNPPETHGPESEGAESQTDSARRNAGGQDSRNRLQDCDAALRSQLESSGRLNAVRREITLAIVPRLDPGENKRQSL